MAQVAAKAVSYLTEVSVDGGQLGRMHLDLVDCLAQDLNATHVLLLLNQDTGELVGQGAICITDQ